MHRVLMLAMLTALFVVPSARAGGGLPFEYTATGDSIPDDFLMNYPLFMDPEVEEILSIELEINELSHSSPADLDIILIAPNGEMIEIMSDLGGQTAISDVDLIFNDAASPSLPGEPIVSGTYAPEGLVNTTDSGFATFVGDYGGTTPPGAWNLIVVDDAPGDLGSFGSYTLRGTFVPEPMTLSLLAMGAVAAFRRRRPA